MRPLTRSPDGTRVALAVLDQGEDIWIWDIAQERLTPLTFESGRDIFPVWSPDGRRLVFSSSREGAMNLFSRAADSTGAVDRLTEGPNVQFPHSFSSDDQRLVFWETALETGPDLRVLSVGGGRRSEPLLVTEFAERNAEVSPNGRWLAYESNRSGMYEIYVQPFPNVDDSRWQVSTGGGTRPLWAPNGRELFYVDSVDSGLFRGLIGVPVQTEPTFSYGNSEIVFEGQYTNSRGAGRSYDISPDGQRFLMIKEAAADTVAAPTQLHVVLNWLEELKRLVPTN